MLAATRSSPTESLAACLKRLDQALNPEDWLGSLSPRKREEATFHDWTHGPDIDAPGREEQWTADHPNMKFYATDRETALHREAWIRKYAPGQVVLDYACGRGTLAMMAAAAGAALSIGIDISAASIQTCRRRAAAQGLGPNTYFLVADCERTGLPDNSVDRIITAGCLHHLDLSYAFPEMRRILKPGGRIYAVEALAYNPVIQLYRRLTPHLRTSFEREHILSLRELRFARHFFAVENVRYFHLVSLATTPLRHSRWFARALEIANAIDRVVLKIPPLRYLAWSFSFELVKRNDG